MTSERLPHWDLSNVYPGLESEEFGQATSLITAQIEDLGQYLAANEIARGGAVPQDPAVLAETITGTIAAPDIRAMEMIPGFTTPLGPLGPSTIWMAAGFSRSAPVTAIRAPDPPRELEPRTVTSPSFFAILAASSPSLLWLIMITGLKRLNLVT